MKNMNKQLKKAKSNVAIAIANLTYLKNDTPVPPTWKLELAKEIQDELTAIYLKLDKLK